jgi:hypothetical protein
MLTPDVAVIEQSLSNFSTVMKTVNGYVENITMATFFPVDIGGTQVDLLAPFPTLKANIATAQQHANVFLELGILIAVLLGISNYNSTFQSVAGEILDTLDDANRNPNMQPTPAQQQSINANLQSLLDATTAQQQTVQGFVAPTRTFENQLPTDYANLSGGEQPISAAINSIYQWVKTETLEVSEGIGGQGLAQTIAQVGSELTAGLNNILNSLESLASQNEAASEALSDVLTVWQTLIAKYKQLIFKLQEAGNAGILEAGDVRSAQTAWSQINNYIVTLV